MQNVSETRNLIGSDEVEGTEVRNPQGEKLGTIERVMIDKITGQVAYAVMSFGGFLGMGEKYHPLPWDVLDYDVNQEAYVVNLNKDVLENAPTITEPNDPRVRDTGFGAQVTDYYQGMGRGMGRA